MFAAIGFSLVLIACSVGGQLVCNLAPEHGPCEAHMLRWYFDSQNGVCNTFFYGGCEGNANNFETEEQCQKECMVSEAPLPPPSVMRAAPVECLLPSDVGPCDGLCPRWYFDTTECLCKLFGYGCCEGNDNNFPDQETCQLICEDTC